MATSGIPIDHVADFYSVRADFPLAELRSGEVVVVGSDRRYRSKGRCMLWLAVLGDRALVSTQHELVEATRHVVEQARTPEELLAEDFTSSILRLCENALGPGAALRGYDGVKLYCCAEHYVRTDDPNVRRITHENTKHVMRHLREEGIPDDADYLLADNAAFAYWLEEIPVAFAGTHPVGEFSDRIGNIMVGVLEPYRRRGYGKALVSATTGELLRQGRTVVWGALADNVPAIKTAHSVGYELYCRLFEVRFR